MAIPASKLTDSTQTPRHKPTRPAKSSKPEASRPTIILLAGLHIFLLLNLFSAPQIAKQAHLARTIPDFPCSLSDYTRTLCAGPKDCFYARAGSCVEFVACRWYPVKQTRSVRDIVEGNGSGSGDGAEFRSEAVIHRCPHADPRLEWNDIRKRCDYPGTRGTCGALGAEGEESQGSLSGDRNAEWRSPDGRITSHKALVKWLWKNAFRN